MLNDQREENRRNCVSLLMLSHSSRDRKTVDFSITRSHSILDNDDDNNSSDDEEITFLSLASSSSISSG